ncbi:MAG: GatB/YqeY domain-containing protein [Gemmatimonadota bacterium]
MSSDLKSRIQADLNAARKARDKDRTLLLSTTLSEIRNREIAEGGPVDDAGVVEVVAKAVKQRREAAEQMGEAGRDELAARETREAEMLQAYLPDQLSETEVRAMVREAIEAGADSIGPVMGRIMPKLKGRFEGKEANRIVREELAKG